MHFYNYRILFQIKREYSQHTTRLLCILRKRGSLSMGRSDTASSPTQWKLKRENTNAPKRRSSESFFRSGCLRDASKGLSSRVNQVVPFLMRCVKGNGELLSPRLNDLKNTKKIPLHNRLSQ